MFVVLRYINFFHIGNARTFVVFDTIRRYLEYRGYKVKFIQNFTDIDDKMIKRANEEGSTVKELGDRFIKEYYKDADDLNIERATKNPRATEFMEEIIKFVSDLIEKGYAYEIDGDVYFSTKKFNSYGKLSGQNLEELQLGARINVDERKKRSYGLRYMEKPKAGRTCLGKSLGNGKTRLAYRMLMHGL